MPTRLNKNQILQTLVPYFFILMLLINLSADVKQRTEKPADHSSDDPPQNNVVFYGVSGTFTSTMGIGVQSIKAESWATTRLNQQGDSNYQEIDFKF